MTARKMRPGLSIRGHGDHPAAWRHPDVPANPAFGSAPPKIGRSLLRTLNRGAHLVVRLRQVPQWR